MAQQSFIAYWPNSDNNYGVEVRCTSVPDVANNRSTVTVEVILRHWWIDISSRSDGKIVIDGVETAYSTKAIKSESTDEPVATRTVIVDHDSDGAKSVDVSASFNYRLTSNTYGKVGVVTAGGTFVLDTIGRASTILSQTTDVVANGNDEWIIKMKRASDKFWHKATLTLGSLTFTTDPFETEITTTASTDWLNYIQSTSGTMRVSIQTYSDESCSTPIGDPVTTTFTVKKPDDAAPICYGGWCITSYQTLDYDGNLVYEHVQNFTILYIQFDPSLVVTKYGATLHSFRVEIDGKTYEKTVSGNDKVGIYTDTIKASGTVKYSVFAVDSRGAASMYDRECYVYEHFTPRLQGVEVFRCDDKGNKSESGTYISAKADVIYAPCNDKNKVDMGVSAVPAGNESAGEFYTGSPTSGTPCVFGEGEISTQKSYNVHIYAKDIFGSHVTYSATISTDDVSFHIRDGGKGGAFGKYSEEDDVLDVAWKLKVEGVPVVGAKLCCGVSFAVTVKSSLMFNQYLYGNNYPDFVPGLYLAFVYVKWPYSTGGTFRSLIVSRGSTILAEDEATSGGGQMTSAFCAAQLAKSDALYCSLLQNSGEELEAEITYTIVRIGG